MIEKFFHNRYLLYILPIGVLVVLFIASSLFSMKVLKSHHAYHIEKYHQEFLSGKEDLLRSDIQAVVNFLVQNPQCKDRKKLIEKISEIVYENGRYVFIFSYDHATKMMQPIVNPNIPKDQLGKNIDPNALNNTIKRDFVLDIVSSLQNGKVDDFFLYNFKEPHSNTVSKKLSYVYYYEPFNWYIGTGVHIAILDQYLHKEMQHLEKDLTDLIEKHFYISLVLVLFFVGIIYLIIRYVQNKQHNLVQYKNILTNIKNEIAVYYWICTIEKEQFYCKEISSNHLDHIQNIDDMLQSVVKNDYENVKSFFQQLTFSRENQLTEFRLMIEKRVRYFKCYCNFVSNNLAKKDEVMVVLVDITPFKEKEIEMIEDQLVFIQDKIDRDFLDFINMIAHQWRHPIGYINSKLIDLDIEPFDKKEFVNDIENTTEFLSNTIEDFSSIFSNQNSITAINFQECFENVLKILGSRLINISVEKNYQKDLTTAGSSTKLQQVLMIVLKNSIDAFQSLEKQNKTIWIKTSTEQENILIEIYDNAQGAKQSDIEKLFDLYYTTKHGENKGLGLYMSKLLIERFFRGNIVVKNYKEGFKTTLIIPIEHRYKDEI